MINDILKQIEEEFENSFSVMLERADRKDGESGENWKYKWLPVLRMYV